MTVYARPHRARAGDGRVRHVRALGLARLAAASSSATSRTWTTRSSSARQEAGVDALVWAQRYIDRTSTATWPSSASSTPDVEPRVSHVDRRHRAPDRHPRSNAVTPTPPPAASGSACPRFPTYGALSNQKVDELRSEPTPGRGGKRHPADFALWKGNEGRRACVGQPLGPRAARLAHRVLGDGRRPRSVRRSTSTAAGSTSCSPTTRTRSRSPNAPTAHSLRPLLDAQRPADDGLGGQKMGKSLGNVVNIHDLLREWPGRGRAPVLPPEPLPLARCRGRRGGACPTRWPCSRACTRRARSARSHGRATVIPDDVIHAARGRRDRGARAGSGLRRSRWTRPSKTTSTPRWRSVTRVRAGARHEPPVANHKKRQEGPWGSGRRARARRVRSASPRRSA
jgi:hypothetical protein